MNRGGLTIRQAREGAGLSQAELARRLGTSQNAVWRWENGKTEPPWSTVHRAASACGFAIATILEPVDPDEWRLVEATRNRSVADRLENLRRDSAFAKAGRDAMRRTRPKDQKG